MPSDVKEVTVGIDPGLTETGVVVMDREFNVLSANLIKVVPSAAKRLYDIEQALNEILDKHMMDSHVTIFIEGYAYGAKFQRESLAELGGVLRRYFFVNVLTYWVIPPLINKQFVTGTATANKNYMKKMTKEKWDENFKSDDVCDAYGLARLGTCVLNYLDGYPPGTGSVYETKVVAEIAQNVPHYKGANTARRPAKQKTT